MTKNQLLSDLKKAVEDLGFSSGDIVLSIPPKPGFGDYSTNIALQLSKQPQGSNKQSPEEIANEIAENLSSLSYLSDLKVEKPGFLNFFIKQEAWGEDLEEILEKGEGFGKNNTGKGEKVEVEFISANPTGPLTLANGRGGALGDTLSNVLTWNGYQVEREYYVNDTGNQIRLLGESVLAAAGKMPAKDEHYKGGYVKDLAEQFKDKIDLEPLELGQLLADHLLEQEIKPAVSKLGVKFDEFYSERSIYQRSLIDKTVAVLKEKDLAYESEGAVWFRATQFGDEKDRVLLTSETGRGKVEPTYFLADIAHHLDVLGRGYIKRINFLGADHHGYGIRMKGMMEALGFREKVEMVFFQFVRLFQEGKEVKMSKRAGTYVALDELLQAVGKDVVRFFFLMYAPTSHIDFNLNLAKERSEKNPVYYVQYTYARISNILAKIPNPKFQIPNNFQVLNSKEEIEVIKYLGEFPGLVEEVGKTYQVQALPSFALKLADLLNKFYECCPVLSAESEDLKEARLSLVKAAKIVLGNSLSLMGIEAPERM